MDGTQNTTTEPTRCRRCNRLLRCPSPDGYGPKCRTRIRKASRSEVVAPYKPHLVAKAVELLEQGGVLPLRAKRVFEVVSADGSKTYRTAATGQCNCPAGLKTRPYACYHAIAVRIAAVA
ncbi:hypothetical protein PV410_12600 [Streptomyces sp. PA03-5A]|nr:hypothetical protein [Streptomyces sp. PA03-5A]